MVVTWSLKRILIFLQCVRYNKTIGYNTEFEAVQAGGALLSSEKLWAVIVFDEEDENGTMPTHVQYKIRQAFQCLYYIIKIQFPFDFQILSKVLCSPVFRMDSDKVDSTRLIRDRLTRKSSRRRPAFDLKYITHGFVYLQEMIEHSIIEKLTNTSTDGIRTYLQQFPYPCHIYDQYV